MWGCKTRCRGLKDLPIRTSSVPEDVDRRGCPSEMSRRVIQSSRSCGVTWRVNVQRFMDEVDRLIDIHNLGSQLTREVASEGNCLAGRHITSLLHTPTGKETVPFEYMEADRT